MTKIYSVEVVKESRQIVQVEAETNAQAEQLAVEKMQEPNAQWALADSFTTQITGAREKED